MQDYIKIRGAREHNLKNINVDIPKNKLVVFTGVSGSGKSSLAFDTIYAEGQRRYVESLSAYARQFLGIMSKPDVDTIEGLSPAISIEQKTTSHNPRSTVGTVTEIYDYLRLLFARVGHPHCPICSREISQQTSQQITDNILQLIKELAKEKKQARILILSPVVRDRKGEFINLFENLKAQGFTQARIDGKIYNLDQELVLIKTNKHTIEAVVDRISVAYKDIKGSVGGANLRSRIADSVEQALKLSEGLIVVAEVKDKSFSMPQIPKEFKDHLYSEHFACPVDNISLPEIEPRTFSFNSPHGACPTCRGLGTLLKIKPDLILKPSLSLSEGAILPMSTIFEKDTWYSRLIAKAMEEVGVDIRTPVKDFSKEQLSTLLCGTGRKVHKVYGENRFGTLTSIEETFPGIIAELESRYSQTDSDFLRWELEKYMVAQTCPSCRGARLKKEALSITVGDKSIADICQLQISDAEEFIKNLSGFEAPRTKSPLSEREQEIGRLILKEISSRLSFLVSVGLDYLTLGRPAATLAGGEAQRIRLASQIGSGLSGVLYVLDEPTIGLHQKDNKRLIKTLKTLRDLGNTLLIVEHDREMMESADWILDFGPGAGKSGGAIVAQGDIENIKNNKKSLTGEYLKREKSLWIKTSDSVSDRHNDNNGILRLTGAEEHNLKKIDINFPLGKFICITGVSGSGKSTLLVDTLYPAIRANLGLKVKSTGLYKKLTGFEKISQVSLIDQSPIGRTPRSNPATYTGVFTPVRQFFAQTTEARIRGYKPGRFSFNVKGGRCEACEGQGVNRIKMQFLSDVYVTCEVCFGSRFNLETLEVEWHGKNIADVLKLTVGESYEFFKNIHPITQKLESLLAVGLDYIELGQSAPTLSGGEAQRVKLAAELDKRSQAHTFYLLDEPTTGLHFADLEKLIVALHKLVEAGNTVVVIEHNLDVIKNADWVIDLGPDGGELGGEAVAQGTPFAVAQVKKSYTGQFLAKIFTPSKVEGLENTLTPSRCKAKLV